VSWYGPGDMSAVRTSVTDRQTRKGDVSVRMSLAGTGKVLCHPTVRGTARFDWTLDDTHSRQDSPDGSPTPLCV